MTTAYSIEQKKADLARAWGVSRAAVTKQGNNAIKKLRNASQNGKNRVNKTAILA